MEFNKKYDKQMISVDTCIFSIMDKKLKVLLIQRAKEPFSGKWSLVGGGVYNDETCQEAVKRELREKLGISNVNPQLCGVYSDPSRDPRFRNISISYSCLTNKTLILKNSEDKVLNSQWFSINDLPELAFDHSIILGKALEDLKSKVFDMNYMKEFLPKVFTLGTLQEIYESILGISLDKRNFRRKLMLMNCLKKTGEKNTNDPHKKSDLYVIK